MKTYNSLQLAGVNLVIGQGASLVSADLLEKAGIKKVFIVTDQNVRRCGLIDGVLSVLTERAIQYEIFDEINGDPDDLVCMKAVESLRKSQCEGVVAIGGGSVMDTAKVAKLLVNNDGNLFEYDNSPKGGKKFKKHGKYLICIPTTSGTGCEVTPYVIITNREENRKATINSPLLLAEAALLDPNLTLHMPPGVTASTGMDALAHAIGGYTSDRSIHAGGSTLLSDTLELKSIQLIAENLRNCVFDGSSVESRLNMMLASTIGGIVISAGGDASHGLGHALGARYHIPHGIACAMMMPYVMEYNWQSCPHRFADIAKMFGVDTDNMTIEEAAQSAIKEVKALMSDIGIPNLRSWVKDISEEEFEKLCECAVQDKCSKLNPRCITKEVAAELFKKAYEA